jgi:hypothetical protein
MFPNDAKTKTIFTDASGGTFCPVILEASSEPRTLLQGVIITTGANAGKIKIGDDTKIYLDNELQNFVFLNSPVKFQNEAIICERANNKPFQFTITYVDYDLTTQASNLVIENPTDPTGNFIVEKRYTYGDITSILLSGAIFFLLIFYVLKRIFTHDQVSIHAYEGGTKF